jgi:hypothetical protein
MLMMGLSTINQSFGDHHMISSREKTSSKKHEYLLLFFLFFFFSGVENSALMSIAVHGGR